MKKTKPSISRAASDREIGEFWDKHDLGDYWTKTKPAAFEVDLGPEITDYAVDKELSDLIQDLAQKRGVAAHTLVNLWMQEKLKESAKSRPGQRP